LIIGKTIKKGGKIKRSRGGRTPLQFAVENDHSGVDNFAFPAHDFPISYINGHLEICIAELLIQKLNFELNVKDKCGLTAFPLALE
jgi:hypothetical protein